MRFGGRKRETRQQSKNRRFSRGSKVKREQKQTKALCLPHVSELQTEKTPSHQAKLEQISPTSPLSLLHWSAASVEIACSRPSISATNHHTSEASAESKKIRCCRTHLTSLRAHNCGTVPSSQELAKLSRPLRPLLRERHRSKKGISSPAAAGFVHGIGILCIAPNPPISASSQDDAP